MSVMPQIKHIIYYMLENRSFDNILGWLYEGNDRPAHVIAGPRTVDLPFQGLAGGDHYNSFDEEPCTRHYVVRGVEKDNIPAFDPHEPFEHVNVQLFGSNWAGKDVPYGTPPTMSGFLQDYSSALKGPLAALADAGGQVGALAKAHSESISREEALQILQTNSPSDLPVMNGLARSFGVSDLWFASVPTQTFANRAFSVCGTSLGLVDNATSLFGYVPHKFNTKSIWNVLSDNGFNQPADWMVYHQTKQLGAFCLTQCAFDIPEPERHLTHAQALLDAIDSDTLPRFSYLEPSWLRHDVI
ncbi:MAG TPA: alkaline phosphatase family protein, partial [Hyalangium sp.]|nr:alkaline phosphatase family protein [Hyalangium sp.]